MTQRTAIWETSRCIYSDLVLSQFCAGSVDENFNTRLTSFPISTPAQYGS